MSSFAEMIIEYSEAVMVEKIKAKEPFSKEELIEEILQAIKNLLEEEL